MRSAKLTEDRFCVDDLSTAFGFAFPKTENLVFEKNRSRAHFAAKGT
jgi:hypothetical protein